MNSKRPSPSDAMALVICLVAFAAPLRAQGIEIMPFGGYRFGGDFFEVVAEHPADLDGAPALGFVLNVPLSDGLQVEALVTRQSAHVSIPTGPLGPPTRWHITVDHVQGGGLREFSGGRVRPFLTGVLGLTRYAAEGSSEIRFTTGAGGGVKLFPVSNFGFRLDGRLYATFVDADLRFLACTPGTCITAGQRRRRVAGRVHGGPDRPAALTALVGAPGPAACTTILTMMRSPVRRGLGVLALMAGIFGAVPAWPQIVLFQTRRARGNRGSPLPPAGARAGAVGDTGACESIRGRTAGAQCDPAPRTSGRVARRIQRRNVGKPRTDTTWPSTHPVSRPAPGCRSRADSRSARSPSSSTSATARRFVRTPGKPRSSCSSSTRSGGA